MPLTFNLSAGAETDILLAEIHDDQLLLKHSRGGCFRLCEVIPLPVAVALAKGLLMAVAETVADEALIARYEAECDARADAISAHWEHD